MNVYKVQYWKVDHWVSIWAGLSFERARQVLGHFLNRLGRGPGAYEYRLALTPKDGSVKVYAEPYHTHYRDRHPFLHAEDL